MRIIDTGHRYELAGSQTLQFIKKELSHLPTCASKRIVDYGGPTKCDCNGLFITVNEGTTNEEVLEVLIDRLVELQKKATCKHNACAITHLEEALHWLNARTADRNKRGVEGSPAK